MSISSEVTITKAGFEIFGEPYKTGTKIDPITVNANITSSACADGIPAPEKGTGSQLIGGADQGDATVAVASNQAGEQADVCVAREVTGGDLSWGVKGSFRAYATGKIAKGSVNETGFGGASGAFNVAANGIGSAQFGGSTNFTGHKGILDTTFSNPRVQLFGNGGGVLYVDVKSNDTSGKLKMNSSGIALANLSGATPVSSGDTITVNSAAATLTSSGSAAFGGFYGAGEALDPVSFEVTLGGEVPCSDETDPESAAALAATGSEMQPMLMAGAALIALLGAAVIRASRRRSHQVR